MTPISKVLCTDLEQLKLSVVTNALKLVVEPTWEKEFHKGALEWLLRRSYSRERTYLKAEGP
jgi:uncharacterized membrane protein YeiB